MKKVLLNLAVMATLASLMSCGGDDPLPAPVPSFTASTPLGVFEINHPIQFINSSTNSSSYTWDFGDGNVSTEASPTHTYQEPGSFTVRLTAISEDEQMIEADLIIDVGERVLKEIDILSISFDNFDEGGNIIPWDVDSGPDIILLFGPDDDPQFENTILAGPVADVTEPFTGLILGNVDNAPIDLTLTNEPWTFALLDDDSEIEQGAVELMITAESFNPTTISNASIDPDTGQGIFQIAAFGFDVIFIFEIE
ncbi:MAG: PKD domain-containing protein [Cyclobacteriaceae bacterium]